MRMQRKRAKKFEQSNLFVTHIDETPTVGQDGAEDVNKQDSEQNPREEKKVSHKEAAEFLNSDEDDSHINKKIVNYKECKYDLMKDLCCLQILDTSNNKWITVDIFNELLIHTNIIISNHMRDKEILFLFSVGEYKYKKSSGKKVRQMYMEDVTLRYSSHYRYILSVKNSLLLNESVSQEIGITVPFFTNLCVDPELRNVFIKEQKEVYDLERHYIPEKYNGFRSHKHFALESCLRKYQFIRPNAKPFKDKKFKDEFIYLRKDVVNLHTKETWRRLRRRVKPRAKFLKKIRAEMYSKPQKG